MAVVEVGIDASHAGETEPPVPEEGADKLEHAYVTLASGETVGAPVFWMGNMAIMGELARAYAEGRHGRDETADWALQIAHSRSYGTSS